MDCARTSPYCSSCPCLVKTALTIVASLAALVSAIVLVILLVPAVAAVLSFATFSLYIVLGISSLLAIVTALGACSLSQPRSPVEAPSSLKGHFEENPQVLYLPITIDRNTYYILNPSKFDDLSKLRSRVQQEGIVEIVSLEEDASHFLESAAKVHQRALIGAPGYSQYNLYLAVAEFMNHPENTFYQSKASIRAALEHHLVRVEQAMGEATELGTRQAFLSDAAIQELIRFLNTSSK